LNARRESEKEENLLLGANKTLQLRISVPRFGEISPLWHHIKSLWLFFETVFCIWQNVDPASGFLFWHWANFIAVNGQISNKKFSQLVTLVESTKALFTRWQFYHIGIFSFL